MNRILQMSALGFTGLCAEAGAAPATPAPAEPKAPKFASKEYDLDTGAFEVLFGDGSKVELDVNKVNAELQKKAMFHGIAQKIGDSYAGAKGDFTKARESAQSVIDQLLAGEWRAARGEGEAKPRIGELSEAIARVKSVDLATATAAVEKADDEKRKTWRAHPKVKAAIAAIRSEKAQAELAKAEASAGAAEELTID